jgi:pilus assembly protein Flp/PilA
MKLIGKLLRDNRGAGAIEYALVASLIAIAAISGYNELGGKVQSHFTNVDQSLSGNL